MMSIQIYPHNTLLKTAYYHYRNIKAKNNGKDDKKGLILDCYSCLIFLAFAVEAIINVVGYKKIDDWQDRYEHKPYEEKMKIISKKLSFTINKNEEPYKTLQTLKKIRNEMAHGKLVEKDERVKSEEHLNTEMQLWSEYATPKYIDNAFHQVFEFKELVGKKMGGNLYWVVEGSDSASGSIPYNPDKPAFNNLNSIAIEEPN